MAVRNIAVTDTLETFRTEFNALSSQDFGDIATLNPAISATSVIGAVNELYSQIAGSLAINITDGSTTETVGNAQTITFNGTTTVTLTTSADHGIAVGDIIRLSATTLPGGTTGVTTATFDNINFQVLSVPSSTTLTIQAATAGSASSGGSVTITPYEPVGPAAQSYGYGFGIGNYGGTITGVSQTTLNGALLADTAGTGGSGTAITVVSTTGFPSAGTILIDNELITYTSKGRFLCISPWNFPVAILIGQISAALACGNKVIVKPSEHTSILGYLVVKKFHELGIPKDALELILGDGSYGETLTKISPLHGVAFTGSLKTAKSIQANLLESQKQIVPLIAETGGINAMIVDSSALLEQVTDDVIRSAFDSAGQRCSALRVLCIQEEIYDDLVTMIKGNISTQTVGDPNDFDIDIGPIINNKALENLNNYISKCKQKGMEVFQFEGKESKTHINPTIVNINSISDIEDEQFGPILHILKYKSNEIDQLIAEINDSGYGLTMGIHTRIESRADYFGSMSNVGNIYINRDMVGAVVGSQPFGGVGLSGSGFKAGGPNYLLQFLNEKVVSKNSVAFGGNTELLNLQEDL